MTRQPATEKLDYELSRVVDSTPLDQGETIPVVIRVTDPARLDDAEVCVEDMSGSVRHRLEALSAVSAWIPIGAVLDLAGMEFVDTMELAQPEQVAQA